ncbi:MAG: YbbR-like domain-containing protein [candidate division NC10 bacterium]|nr:YbbR-like domain-containing protein [candidate division NC10 bacterium]MBI2163627.1 YbbR-like domain-containing protein [candidate division NC10 bacterium]MBI2561798.1 YbbR-like domain-containing protein [candidate division NC10 bacterium]MBI3086061.1 YbbR-like domain-containing protein [candidate division NC10 bacterium]MBI3121683.1 YbbR-like domain-containing protein [candidate division NC10 bacterium]
MGIRSRLLANLGLKLLSVVLAVFLWAVVLGEQKVEVTRTVPLEITNLPRDLILVNDPPDSLEVRLRGPKTLVTTLASREVDLEGLPKSFVEGENVIAIRPETVRVPRGIEVVEVTPRRVRVVLDAMAVREVEVSPRVEGAPAKGFALKRVTSTPARIRMAGPKNELRRLTRVYTVPISLDGQTASFTTRAMLEPAGRQIRALDEVPIIVGVEIGSKRS